MKSPVFLLLAYLLPSWVLAQQQAHYSQYLINNYLINPAIAGIENYADIKLGYRNQWTGLKGAPTTLYLSGHTQFGNSAATTALHETTDKPVSFGLDKKSYGQFRKVKAHHGAGGIILLDKIGPFTRTEISATYAYHVPLTNNIRLAGGLAAGVINQALRADYLDFADPGDVMATGWSRFRPNVAAGLWLYAPNFYAGASAAQIFGNTFSAGSDRGNLVKNSNHYFVTAAYKIQPAPNLALVPSVLISVMQPLPVTLNYNLRAVYADRFWSGVSFRQLDSFAVLAGITLHHNLDISYAYDLVVSDLGTQTGGSHEVVLGIRLKNPNKIICPQNLW